MGRSALLLTPALNIWGVAVKDNRERRIPAAMLPAKSTTYLQIGFVPESSTGPQAPFVTQENPGRPLADCGKTRQEQGPLMNADQRRSKTINVGLSYRRSIGGQFAFFPN